MAATVPEQLKRVLKPIHLWAIAVGLVISGEYFGWNYGWGVAGTIGFLIATIIITVMYVTFIFSYTELTTAIPHAGGAFAYAYRAMGPFGGLVAGYATLIDFLLATPAIAAALGAYLNFLYPSIPIIPSALLFNLVFMVLNISGVKESAAFSVFITVLAVLELLLFMGVVGPHFKMSNYLHDPMPFGWGGVFAALPFAVWFYLAIEGVAMVAEEVKDPKRNIPKGYISGLATLIFLAFGVMIITGGITYWQKLDNVLDPLPKSIAIALLHGTVLAGSRQVFAMARSGYLPGFLAGLTKKFKTPHRAIVAGGIISVAALCFDPSAVNIVILSALGAVTMYMMSMVSLFILRTKEPNLERSFASPFYPVFPAIALIISAIAMFAIIWYHWQVSLIFFAGLGVAVAIFVMMGKHKVRLVEENMTAPIII
jgi:ethanolamine permease